MFRKNMYRWHRTASLIISIPIVLWASSGLMHPVMTTLRPAVSTQLYTSPGIDTAQMQSPLAAILSQYRIDSFHAMRIVRMGGQQFFQLSLAAGDTDIRYFSTQTGKMLPKGDELYARFLAKQFLDGDASGEKVAEAMETAVTTGQDCCMMATENILNNSKGSPVLSVARTDRFTGEYKSINRLLPVYRVSFQRRDGVVIYVQTTTDRFSFATDHRRMVFDTFFGWFHTWEWMNALGSFKYVVMVLITLLGFSTACLGLYIFFTTSSKKKDHILAKSRRRHRYTSVIASLFTLLFTFSGGYHAWSKLWATDDGNDHIGTRFSAAATAFDPPALQHAAGRIPMQDISLVRLHDGDYWRIALKPGRKIEDGRADLMRSQSVASTATIYASTCGYRILADGERQYAEELATLFSNRPATQLESLTLLTAFNEEYNFSYKRLPVWEARYSGPGHERFYVDPATAILAGRISDKDVAEGYSFAFFHKHHFMDWAGKTVRDVSTMVAASLQILMVIIGLTLYIRWRRKRGRGRGAT